MLGYGWFCEEFFWTGWTKQRKQRFALMCCWLGTSTSKQTNSQSKPARTEFLNSLRRTGLLGWCTCLNLVNARTSCVGKSWEFEIATFGFKSKASKSGKGGKKKETKETKETKESQTWLFHAFLEVKSWRMLDALQVGESVISDTVLSHQMHYISEMIS